MRPAGLEKSVGIITAGYYKEPTDPRWQDTPEYKEWLAWMKKYNTSGNIADGNGPGKLTVLDSFGGGAVILTGTNTYSGGTTICFCGTLQLGDATHTGSIVGAVTNFDKDERRAQFNSRSRSLTKGAAAHGGPGPDHDQSRRKLRWVRLS